MHVQLKLGYLRMTTSTRDRNAAEKSELPRLLLTESEIPLFARTIETPLFIPLLSRVATHLYLLSCKSSCRCRRLGKLTLVQYISTQRFFVYFMTSPAWLHNKLRSTSYCFEIIQHI